MMLMSESTARERDVANLTLISCSCRHQAMKARLGYEGRVAVVTGAGRGLGRAYAKLLADRGAAVVVADTGASVHGEGSDPSVAEAVAREIEDAGGSAVAAIDSVDTAQGAAAVVGLALESFGRVDILINNAGILQDKTFANMTTDMFDAVLAVHVMGAMHVTKAAWPHLVEQRYGRIVNATSTAGLFGNFGQANYATAKMGLVGFTRVLAIEGARY